MALEHEIQRKIILKLIHHPHLGFNELWAKDGESNTFAYHVNKLEEQNIIVKQEGKDGKYSLTEEGRKLSAFIEGDTGELAKFPTLTVLLVVQRGEKYLCQKRLKEPFFGYWSFVSGKINFGQNPEECATRDLLEETGLHTTDWQFKGIEIVKTFDGEKLLYHHYLLVMKTTNVTGTLKEKTHKAEHAWMTLEAFHNKEGFPGHWCSEHIANAAHPIIVQGERFMKAGKFIGAKTISVKNN